MSVNVSRDLVTPRSPHPVQIPLSLPLGPCWELEERPVDSTTFLQALPSAFPEATAAFFEGSSIAPDIVQIFDQHADSGPYLPQTQTLWSTGSILRFRCLFTPSLWEALATASLHHAEPELFDHLFLRLSASFSPGLLLCKKPLTKWLSNIPSIKIS